MSVGSVAEMKANKSNKNSLLNNLSATNSWRAKKIKIVVLDKVGVVNSSILNMIMQIFVY